MKISIAKKLDYTKYGLEEKSIYEVLEIIQRGDMQLFDSECGRYELKTITEAIRNQKDPKIQNEWKARFCRWYSLTAYGMVRRSASIHVLLPWISIISIQSKN